MMGKKKMSSHNTKSKVTVTFDPSDYIEVDVEKDGKHEWVTFGSGNKIKRKKRKAQAHVPNPLTAFIDAEVKKLKESAM